MDQNATRFVDQVSQRNRAAVVILSLGLPLVTLTAAHVFFTPIYQTPDDVGMSMLASGTGSVDEPSPWLMSSSYLYGLMITRLYENLPGVAWYRVIQILLQYVSMAIMVGVLLRREFSAARTVLLVLFLAVFDLWFHVWPQFTITAAILAMASVAIWQLHAESGRITPWSGLASAILIALSAMLRPDSTWLILMLASPVVAISLFGTWRDNRIPGRRIFCCLRLSLPLLVGCALALGVVFYERHLYATTEGWENFHEFRALLARFVDYVSTSWYSDETKWIFDREGWSSNDYMMMLTWFVADEQVYSIEKMRRILEAFESSGLDPGLPFHVGLSEFYHSHDRNLLLAVFFTPLLFIPWRRLNLLPVVAVYAAALSATAILGVYIQRMPPRVSLPIFAFVLFQCAFYCAGRSNGRRRPVLNVVRIAAIVLIVILLVPSWRRKAADFELMRRNNDIHREALRRLDPQADELFVVWIEAYPWHFHLPFDDYGELDSMRMYVPHPTPINQTLLESFEIDDVQRAMYTRSDVFVVSREHLNARFIRFVKEHHGIDIAVERVARLGIEVYQFFPADSPRDMGNILEPVRLKRILGRHIHTLGQWPTVNEGFTALGLNSDDISTVDPARVHQRLAQAYDQRGDIHQAIHHYRLAARLNGAFADARYRLAILLDGVGKTNEAMKHFHSTIKTKPQFVPALIQLAKIYASDRYDEIRSGAKAMALATKAAALTGHTDAAVLDVLAMACAEAGDFNQAIIHCEKAMKIARESGQYGAVDNIKARWNGYLLEKPWRRPGARSSNGAK